MSTRHVHVPSHQWLRARLQALGVRNPAGALGELERKERVSDRALFHTPHEDALLADDLNDGATCNADLSTI